MEPQSNIGGAHCPHVPCPDHQNKEIEIWNCDPPTTTTWSTILGAAVIGSQSGTDDDIYLPAPRFKLCSTYGMFSSVSTLHHFLVLNTIFITVLFFRAKDVSSSWGGFPIENILTLLKSQKCVRRNWSIECFVVKLTSELNNFCCPTEQNKLDNGDRNQGTYIFFLYFLLWTFPKIFCRCPLTVTRQTLSLYSKISVLCVTDQSSLRRFWMATWFVSRH